MLEFVNTNTNTTQNKRRIYFCSISTCKAKCALARRPISKRQLKSVLAKLSWRRICASAIAATQIRAKPQPDLRAAKSRSPRQIHCAQLSRWRPPQLTWAQAKSILSKSRCSRLAADSLPFSRALNERARRAPRYKAAFACYKWSAQARRTGAFGARADISAPS